MKIELIILISACLISLLSIFLIPKTKRIQAQFVFLFVQFPAWVLGLSAVELKLLEYPYRELSSINRTSFIFEYFILPVVCVHLNARFPEHASIVKKLGLYIGVASIFTLAEFILERYTEVIKYTGWEWYWTFLSVWFILWVSRVITLWFFGKKKLETGTQ